MYPTESGNAQGVDKLYIADTDYTEGTGAYRECGQVAQQQWDLFIQTSLEIVGQGNNIEGARANAYSAFIQVCAAQFGNRLAEICEDLGQDMARYIEAIDIADSALY